MAAATGPVNVGGDRQRAFRPSHWPSRADQTEDCPLTAHFRHSTLGDAAGQLLSTAGRGRPLPLWRRVVLALLRVQVIHGEASAQIERGPIILALNHASFLDGVLVAVASPRPLHFPVNLRHSRQHPATRRILAWMERQGLGTVVPMDRTSVFGIRRLREALIAGHGVCIFPEGRISGGDAGTVEAPGYLWLQERTGRPVVWGRIEGAERSRLWAKSGDQLWPQIRLFI